jgi:hypothetical protein
MDHPRPRIWQKNLPLLSVALGSLVIAGVTAHLILRDTERILPKPTITMGNFDRIQIGMTKDQVDAILRQEGTRGFACAIPLEGKTPSPVRIAPTYTYVDKLVGGDLIRITYDSETGNRVVKKEFQAKQD